MAAHHILSINVGGAPGAWRLYEEKFSGALIVALQECNMSEEEWQAFAHKCKQLGYQGYFLHGPPSDDPSRKCHHFGGVASLVHRSVFHSFASSLSHWGVQSVAVWIQGSLLINCYSPPGHDAAVPHLFGHLWAQHRLDSKPWVVVGDFNEHVDTSAAGHYLKLHGGLLLGNPDMGSRWKSDRFIDWGMCSSPQKAIYVGQHDQVHISDHIGFWVQSLDIERPTHKGRLKPAPSWIGPSWLSSSQWTDQLQQSWNEHVMASKAYHSLRKSFLVPSSSCDQNKVQEEWDLFMHCLRICFWGAFQDLSKNPQCNEDQKQELRKKISQSGFESKGKIATFQWVNEKVSPRGDPNPGEQIRKKRRTIARLYEVRRCCFKKQQPPDSLLKKIWNSPMDHHSFPELLQCAGDLLQQTQETLTRLEEQQKNQRIASWKTRLNDPTLKGIASWLRRKATKVCTASVIFREQESAHPIEIAAFIHQFWTELWCENNQNLAEKAAQLITDFGPTEKQQWDPITETELIQAVKGAKGAKGPDQWTGEEIKCLPLSAVSCYHKCSLRWFYCGLVPAQFCESRQVNLFKPHKIQEGKIKTADIRPISVLSVFWRVYSSAWAKSDQIRLWTRNHLHVDVAHGSGVAGAEALAEQLQDIYASNNGCLASLDWAQAFDRMHPQISCDSMKAIGLAPPLACLLTQVWGKQQRFLEFDGHVHPHRLFAGGGMPQGDPLSPLILAVWVTAGLRHLEKSPRIPSDSISKAVCYMDDRSFWCNSAEGTLARISIWADWSSAMGLKESPQKIQIIAKEEATIVGVTSVSKRRKCSSKELERLQEAHQRALILSYAPLNWTLKIRAFQSLVISKAAFGWIGQHPPISHSNSLFSTLSRNLETGKAAARELRKLFYGSITWLPIVVTTRRWSRLFRALKKDRTNLHWNRQPFTAVNNLRIALKNLGFVESRPWTWSPSNEWLPAFPNNERSLNLTTQSRQPLEKQLHIIRRMFKVQAFHAFTQHPKRRDAALVRNLGNQNQILQIFAKIDLKKSRKILEDNGAIRAAFLGSFYSPAARFNGPGLEDIESTEGCCTFCLSELGTYEHCVWHCSQNPYNFPTPSNPLQKRFGWHVIGNKNNGLVTDHIARSLDKLWHIRHSDMYN